MTTQKVELSEYYSLSKKMSISSSPTLEYRGTVNKQLLLAEPKGILRSVWCSSVYAVHASDIDFYVKRGRVDIERY